MSDELDVRDAGLWRSWIRHTVTAVGSAATVLVAVTLFAGDTSRDAAEALSGVRDHRPRIENLERHEAEDRQVQRALIERLEETRADVKELLRRVPPR